MKYTYAKILLINGILEVYNGLPIILDVSSNMNCNG